MPYDSFEEQFNSTENSVKQSVLRSLMDLRESWPDVLATWDGMVAEAIQHGWEPLAARTLVLSSVTGDNLAIFANLHASDED